MAHFNIGNDTTVPTGQHQYFVIGWFQVPVDNRSDYEVIEILHVASVCLSFISNPLLLGIIIKNLVRQHSRLLNSAMLLVNICLCNLVVAVLDALYAVSHFSKPNQDNIITPKVSAITMSIIAPIHYSCIFLITLSNFGLIVKPLKFKTLAFSKKRAVLLSSFMLWVFGSTVCIITPLLTKDFAEYLKIQVTCVVAVSWLVTVIIVILNVIIVITLRNRNITMETTFNMSGSRQGFVIMKQNTRLAKTVFIFTTGMVLATLPMFTSYLVILHCPTCHYPANEKFALYTTPLFFSLQSLSPLYWVIAIPQYFKDAKRLARMIFNICC